jgi:hypothetical protein
MAHNVSLATVNKLKDRITRMAKSTKALRDKGSHALLAVADTVVVNAGAFGTGIGQGYFGEKRFFGIWWEWYATALLHGAGIFINNDGASRQFHNLADGVSSAWSSAMGRGIGLKMLAKGGGRRATAHSALKGLDEKLAALEGLTSRGGGGMAEDEELMRVARRM